MFIGLIHPHPYYEIYIYLVPQRDLPAGMAPLITAPGAQYPRHYTIDSVGAGRKPINLRAG
jgi:hypothetical protein